MEIAILLMREVFTMFLFIAAGMVCRAKGILNAESARAVSNMVLLLVTPALLIQNLQAERALSLLPAMGLALVVSAVYHFLAAKVANLAVRDPGDGSTAWRVTKMSITFSNAGFMGFPLLYATVGEDCLLYGVVFLGVFNVASWMWGVPTLTGKKGLSPLQLITNPAVACFLIGSVLYLMPFRLPYVVQTVIGGLGGMNTPLSMVVVGVFLLEVKVRDVVRDPLVYKTILLRNIFLPLLLLLLLWASKVSVWLPGGREFALSMLILVGCPSAAASILMPARYGCDSAQGSKLVAVSTAISIVTLPFLVMVGDLIL